MSIYNIKEQLKERIALGLTYGIKSVEEIIRSDSVLKNEFIGLKSQYSDLNNILAQNTLAYKDIEQGLNKIRMGLIGLIDRMEAGDIVQKDVLPKPRNNEVEFRKNNFFRLLDIHLSNMQAVQLKFMSSSESIPQEVHTGREALRMIYKDFFVYDFKQPSARTKQYDGDIQAYARDFFEQGFSRLEVYMNTLKFILAYVQEEEAEQDFFVGVIKSILSSPERALIFYYCLSGIDTAFHRAVLDTELLDKSMASYLISMDHWGLFHRDV